MRTKRKIYLKEQKKDTFTIKDVIKTIDRDIISVDSYVIMFYPEYKEIPVFKSEVFSFYDLPHLKEEYPRTLIGIKNFINNITHSIYTLTLKKLKELDIDINLIEYINIDFDLDESDLEPLIHHKEVHEIPVEYEETEYEVPVKFKQLLERLKK